MPRWTFVVESVRGMQMGEVEAESREAARLILTPEDDPEAVVCVASEPLLEVEDVRAHARRVLGLD
jgi:hypothetical protein